MPAHQTDSFFVLGLVQIESLGRLGMPVSLLYPVFSIRFLFPFQPIRPSHLHVQMPTNAPVERLPFRLACFSHRLTFLIFSILHRCKKKTGFVIKPV